MFLSALVLAPLVAGGVAAHVLATNRAVRETDARLQGVQLAVERAEQRAFDAAQYRLSPGVAKMAFRSPPDARPSSRASCDRACGNGVPARGGSPTSACGRGVPTRGGSPTSASTSA